MFFARVNPQPTVRWLKSEMDRDGLHRHHAYTDLGGEVLGTVEFLESNSHWRWRATFRRNGTAEVFNFLELGLAQGMVERLAAIPIRGTASPGQPHPRECSCATCTNLRHEMQLNYVTWALEDELTAIFAKEEASACGPTAKPVAA